MYMYKHIILQSLTVTNNLNTITKKPSISNDRYLYCLSGTSYMNFALGHNIDISIFLIMFSHDIAIF